MASLYADEDFPRPAVLALRRLGHNALTVADDGRAGQGISDRAVLARARELGRAVLSHNRKHFRNLHNDGHPHAGLILCTRDADFAALASRIHASIRDQTDLEGRLVRVARPPG